MLFKTGFHASPKQHYGRRAKTAAIGLLSLFALMAASCGGTADSAYPERTIELYVPAAPGGGTDSAARILGKHIEQEYDADITIVNQDGGGGAQAVNTVASSKEDGLSLLFFHEAMIVGHEEGSIQQSATDLTPLGAPVRMHQYLMAPADAGWETFDDFVTEAKGSGSFDMAVDFGKTSHYIGQMVNQEAGLDLRLVDGGSEADRINGILGGRFDLIVATTDSAREYSRSGDMVPLAVISPERDPAFDDIPTAVEQGYEINFPLTFMLLGPEGLSDEAEETWATWLASLAEDEDYTEAISQIAEPVNLTSEETSNHISEATAQIEKLHKSFGG